MVSLFVLGIVTAQAANPYAGVYGGVSYVTYSGSINVPEASFGYTSENIDQYGRITGGISGRVDANGNILWNTPNALYVTNGVITNGVITAIGIQTSGALTATYRMAAKFSASDLVGAGKLIWRTPSTGAQYFNAVTYGNGRFVAVGYGGVTATSTDGTNWANIPAVTGRKELADVAFGNGLFVAVGTNWLMTSASGTNWDLSSTNYAFSSVVFGNGQFIAVGTNGSAYNSTDGSNWVSVTGAATGQSFTGVDYANGLFILYGSKGGFQTSADGATWNPVRTNGTTALNGAAYAAGRWVIGGNLRFVTFANATGSDQTATNITAGYSINSVVGVGNLLVAATTWSYPPVFSTNGLNWTLANGLSDSIRSVAYGTNGVFVAVGGCIQTSTDGRAWTIRTTNLPLPVQNKAFGPYGIYNDQWQFHDVRNRRREVRVGQGGLIEMRFVDATNGVAEFTSVASPTTNTLRRILGANLPVAVGDRGTILQYDSANDLWKQIPSPTTADLYDAVNYAQSYFVAVGGGGTIIRATGLYGTNWTVVASGTGNNLYSVFNNGSSANFIAGGDNGTVLFSTDYGASWGARATGVTNRIIRVTTGDVLPTYYAFPESGGFFLNSTNGAANWAVVPMGTPLKMNNAGGFEGGYSQTIQSGYGYGIVSGYTGPGGYYAAPSQPSLSSIAYGNGRFVILSDTNTAVSTNGINWMPGHPETGALYANKPKAIAYGQGIFVAAGGYGLIESSVDGINWTIRNSSLTNMDFNGITYGNGRFVAVGGAGTIYSSTNGMNWEDYSFANVSGTLNAVAYGAGRFVTVGFAFGGNYISRSSTNGVDWVAGTGLFHVTSITFVHDRFIATGTSFPIYISTNGLTWWQSQGQAVNVNGNAFAYAGGRYVGVGDRATFGDGGVIESSMDTTNWYAETVTGSGNLRTALAANGQLVIAGDNGMVLTSSYLETNSPALVTIQPTPSFQAVNTGAIVVYTAAVSGSGPLTYRWLKDGVPLFDRPGISGAATTTLTLTGVNAVAAGNYQFTVANDSSSDISQPVSLAVNGAPVITLQPLNTTITNNAFTNLVAAAIGAPPLSYQWYFANLPVTNGVTALAGANGSVLITTVGSRFNEGNYFLVVSNNYGAVTSTVAHLTVLRGPTISQLPITVTPTPTTNFLSPLLVFPGQTVSVASTVDGTGPLAYQWKLAGSNLAGETNATLTVPNIQGGGVQSYSLLVTNLYGSSLFTNTFTIVGPGTLRPDMVTFANVRPVLDVAALPDGSYLSGGWFENSTGAKLFKFNLANLTGVMQTNIQPVGDYDPGIRTLGVLIDGSVIAGGTFNATSGASTGYSNLVRLLPNGQFDTAFRPLNASTIMKVIPAAGGKFLALQSQDLANTISYIRRFNADGSVDNTFNQIASGTSAFWGLGQQSTGTLWFGANTSGLYKANADGTGSTQVDAGNCYRVFVGADDRIYYSTTLPAAVLKGRNADGATNNFALSANNSGVYALATLPNGKIVIGGNFTQVNGTNINYLAMLNSDGSIDTRFTSPFSSVGGASVNSILLLADGSALLGTSGLNGVRRVQLYMPDMAIQTQPVSQTVNRTATATFGVVASGSSPVNYQWRFNGTNISNATNSTLTLNNVQDSAAGNYDVIVSSVSGTNISSIATLTVLGDAVLTQQPVGQSVLVGGSASFSAGASGATPITFQWRKNGTNIFGATSNVLNLANVSLNDLALYDVVAANFLGSVTSAPAALSVYATTNGIGGAIGTIDTNYLPALLPANSASVISVVLDANNKVLITGSFTNFAGQTRTNFVRLNSDLTVDAPTVVLNSTPVPAIGLTNGGFVLGGYFSTAAGSVRYGLTFYDSAGALLPQPVLNNNGYVDGGYGKNAFATQPDGKVLVGGYFTSVNSTARTNLARLNADGSLDATFIPAAINQQVTTAAVQPDGKILIAGYFTTVGGVAQAAVARLNENGSYDNTFTNTFAFSTPYGIRLQSTGKILIFGYGLTTVGGQSRTGIARLNTDGSLDTNFNAAVTAAGNLSVQDVFVEADDRLVIVGNFTSVGGITRKGVARLNADGTLDTTFATGIGVAGGSALVYSVVKLPSGGYLIGGAFTSYDGVGRRGFALLNGNPQPAPARAILFQPQSQTVTAGATANFTVAATGTAPLTFQWRKDGTNILNATGASLVITNVQASDVANYDVVVTDLGGSTTSQPAALSLQAQSGFATWITGFGLAASQDGANADPDGDGLANAAEYAFGTNPNLGSAGQLPVFAKQNVGGVFYPAVQFTRNRSAVGVTIQVVAWPSLTVQTLLPTVETSVDIGNGLDLVTVRSTYSTTAYPAQFLKVFVTQP